MSHAPRQHGNRNLAPGHRVAGRYEVRGPLGQGASASVYSARDALTGLEVALKWIPLEGVSRARVRLEIAALRRVQRPELTPGVVRLLDDGEAREGDALWLAMERVRGRPFPGAATPCDWATLWPALSSLLVALGRVHAEGVWHRDLKPSNVLVNDLGQSVLIDFGVASVGARLEAGTTEAWRVHGTAAYLAPERRRGDGDARSDLYAVGVMAMAALGARPGMDAALPRVPTGAAETLRRMIHRSPARRPVTAEAALEGLRDRPRFENSPRRSTTTAPLLEWPRGHGPARREGPLQALRERGARWTPDALAARIHGPERLLHLPSDAAAYGVRATGGEPARMADLFERLVHARDATIDGSRLRLSRATLDRLLDASPRRRPQTPTAWLRRARRWLAAGRLALAEGPLVSALRAGIADGDDGLALAAARLWVRGALASRDRGYVARLLYELSRAPAGSPAADRIAPLARAVDTIGQWTPDALERARALPPSPHRGTEQLRWSVRMFVARKVSIAALRDEVAAARRAHPRARHPSWVACFAMGEGRLAYVEERYADAAAHYQRSAVHAGWTTDRLGASLNAASAWMEGFALERAIALADAVRAEARDARLAYYEGKAEWILRTARDRAGHALTPDHALLEAAQSIGAPDLALLVALTEATLAFRAGDREALTGFAAAARRAAGVDNEPLCLATIEALEVALGLRPPDPAARRLADRLAARGVPRLALEVAALVEDPAHLDDARRAWLRGLMAHVPAHLHHVSLGVLSVDECRARLGLT